MRKVPAPFQSLLVAILDMDRTVTDDEVDVLNHVDLIPQLKCIKGHKVWLDHTPFKSTACKTNLEMVEFLNAMLMYLLMRTRYAHWE